MSEQMHWLHGDELISLPIGIPWGTWKILPDGSTSWSPNYMLKAEPREQFAANVAGGFLTAKDWRPEVDYWCPPDTRVDVIRSWSHR